MQKYNLSQRIDGLNNFSRVPEEVSVKFSYQLIKS